MYVFLGFIDQLGVRFLGFHRSPWCTFSWVFINEHFVCFSCVFTDQPGTRFLQCVAIYKTNSDTHTSVPYRADRVDVDVGEG